MESEKYCRRPDVAVRERRKTSTAKKDKGMHTDKVIKRQANDALLTFPSLWSNITYFACV